MAIYYSREYSAAYVPPLAHFPARRTYARTAKLPFGFTNTAAIGLVAVNDQVYLVKVPPCCEIVVVEMYIKFNAWTAAGTLDIGWLTFTNIDQSPNLANPNWLIDGIPISVAGRWFAEEMATAAGTTYHPAAAVRRSVRSQEEVTIMATFRDAVPLEDGTLEGYVTVLVD